MGKNEEKDFVEYLLKIIKSKSSENETLQSYFPENYVETKNGIFLSYVHHNEEDLNSYSVLVSGG